MASEYKNDGRILASIPEEGGEFKNDNSTRAPTTTDESSESKNNARGIMSAPGETRSHGLQHVQVSWSDRANENTLSEVISLLLSGLLRVIYNAYDLRVVTRR